VRGCNSASLLILNRHQTPEHVLHEFTLWLLLFSSSSHGFGTVFRGQFEQTYVCNKKGEYVGPCGGPGEAPEVADVLT
jgi:hypothetical protein